MNLLTGADRLFAAACVLLASAHANSQYVWGPQDLVKMRDYTIDQIRVPVGSANIAVNHRVAVVDPVDAGALAEHQVLDDILRRCIASGASGCDQSNWRPSGRVWEVFKVGTPETVAVTRFYIPSINSHVFIAANEMTGNVTTLEVLRAYPGTYVDEGEMFAIKAPLPGFAEGKLPLSQACGEENQSGLTAMLRIYNNGFVKPELPNDIPLAVRFNDGNHLFTTRNDAAFLAELKRTPGWEIAVRDSDNSNRRAGVWCVPAQTRTLVQSTNFSGIPGDGLTGSVVQAQTHELSNFTLNGNSLTVAPNYQAQTHLAAFINSTDTAGIGINSNRLNTFALTRSLGGYVEYNYVPGQVAIKNAFPKAPLNIDVRWTAIKVNEETGVVYAMSAYSNTIKVHAYDPASNSYLWQISLPEAYRQYRIDDSELHLAGNYLVSYLQNYPSTRDTFKGALLVVPLGGAAPELRIIDLPGQNMPVDFAYNPKTSIGTFADARAQALIHLNFSTWNLSFEDVPFQPYALLVNESSGQLYATQVPQRQDMTVLPSNSSLWKRSLLGGSWTQVTELGRAATDISTVNLAGFPKIMVLNRDGNSSNVPNYQSVDFVDLKTGVKAAALPYDVFGAWNFDRALSALAERK